MADIIPSLFGLTPELYQQAQSQQADKQALQYAQLTPFQQANFAIGRGAYQLAGALGGEDPQLKMISMRNAIARQTDLTDPASMRKGIQALTQANDFVGATQLSNILRDLEYKQAQTFQSLSAGQASLAQAAKGQADIAEIERQRVAYEKLMGVAPPPAAAPIAAPVETAAETGVVTAPVIPQPAITAAALPATGELPAAPAVSAAPAAPAQTRATLNQQIAALEKQQSQLLSLPKIPEAKAQADVIGERIKDLRSQLKPTDIANLEREIDQFRAEGVADTDPRIKNRLTKISRLAGGAETYGVDREAIAKELYSKPFSELTQSEAARVNQLAQANKKETAPRITVNARQEEAFAAGRGKSQSELLTEATVSARTASQSLETVNNMIKLNSSGQLFTGPMANPYVGATSLLASLNLLSPEQATRLAKSEVYDKQAKDLVMTELGGKLGSQISEGDRKFVEARIPQLATSQLARTELLEKIAEIQRKRIEFYQKMNAHANRFNNLNEFDFSQPGAPITAPAASPAGATGKWSIKPVK